MSQSQTQIKFSWLAPASDGGVALNTNPYTIYWDNASNGATWTSLGTVGTLTYTKSSGLTSGLTYKFRVTASNSIAESVASSVLSVIAASAPAAPSGLYVISQSQTEISVGWPAPANNGNAITDYIVNYNQGNLVDVWVNLVSSTAGLTSVTLSSISTPGETFQFKVIAKNQIGESPESSIFPVIAATTPEPPVSLTRD